MRKSSLKNYENSRKRRLEVGRGLGHSQAAQRTQVAVTHWETGRRYSIVEVKHLRGARPHQCSEQEKYTNLQIEISNRKILVDITIFNIHLKL